MFNVQNTCKVERYMCSWKSQSYNIFLTCIMQYVHVLALSLLLPLFPFSFTSSSFGLVFFCVSWRWSTRLCSVIWQCILQWPLEVNALQIMKTHVNQHNTHKWRNNFTNLKTLGRHLLSIFTDWLQTQTIWQHICSIEVRYFWIPPMFCQIDVFVGRQVDDFFYMLCLWPSDQDGSSFPRCLFACVFIIFSSRGHCRIPLTSLSLFPCVIKVNEQLFSPMNFLIGVRINDENKAMQCP